MKVLYFAWLRERIGIGEEDLELPEDVQTVGQLIGWLQARGPEFESAFSRPEIIRAAIDQTHVGHDRELAGAREIAFFPPVTGG